MDKKNKYDIRISELLLIGMICVGFVMLVIGKADSNKLNAQIESQAAASSHLIKKMSKQLAAKQKELDALKSQLASVKTDFDAANAKLNSISAAVATPPAAAEAVAQ